MTYEEIRKNEEVCELIKKGNENLGILGYTDHSRAHCTLVAKQAARILTKLGYSEKEVELVKIAAFMHDIGNAVNRRNHAEYGAILANDILKETDMSIKDRMTVVSAIGHHDESSGGATDVVSAALIIADKTDVRRSRVRNPETYEFNIHDRVNYSVKKSEVTLDKENRMLTLTLNIDTKITPVMDYFEIFLNRMSLCKKAAKKLKPVKWDIIKYLYLKERIQK